MRRLKEVQYIPDLCQNLISPSRLDLRGYRMVADGGILKILYGDRVILEGKKRKRGYYYMVGSLAPGGASGAKRSPE